MSTTDSTQAEILAFRGGIQLTPDEYKAHLANLVRLENIGLLIGAGASRSNGLGGQTVADAWKKFQTSNETDVQWLMNNKFISEEEAKPNSTVNIESLIDVLSISKKEWERVENPELPKLKAALTGIFKCVINAALLDKNLWLTENDNEIVVLEKLKSHLMLLQKLSSSRQPGQPAPWIFTTNYDLAFEWAAEQLGLNVNNGFSGIHNRKFSPHNFDLGTVNTLAKGEAKYGSYSISLAKLHGSLTLVYNKMEEVLEDTARETKKRMDEFLSETDVEMSSLLIFPETAKFFRTASFVFGELFRRFSEFLSKPQSCLIISGYSFCDEHLNRVIRAALNNPTLQIVIYYPDIEIVDDKPFTKNSSLVKNLITLNSPQITFVGGSERAYFDKLADHLPVPSLFDEQTLKIRQAIKLLQRLNSPDGGTGEADASPF